MAAVSDVFDFCDRRPVAAIAAEPHLIVREPGVRVPGQRSVVRGIYGCPGDRTALVWLRDEQDDMFYQACVPLGWLRIRQGVAA